MHALASWTLRGVVLHVLWVLRLELVHRHAVAVLLIRSLLPVVHRHLAGLVDLRVVNAVFESLFRVLGGTLPSRSSQSLHVCAIVVERRRLRFVLPLIDRVPEKLSPAAGLAYLTLLSF